MIDTHAELTLFVLNFLGFILQICQGVPRIG